MLQKFLNYHRIVRMIKICHPSLISSSLKTRSNLQSKQVASPFSKISQLEIPTKRAAIIEHRIESRSPNSQRSEINNNQMIRSILMCLSHRGLDKK